jgi:hypothetical protein
MSRMNWSDRVNVNNDLDNDNDNNRSTRERNNETVRRYLEQLYQGNYAVREQGIGCQTPVPVSARRTRVWGQVC